MAKVKAYYDTDGNTLTVWFGEPQAVLSKDLSAKDDTLARTLEREIAQACIRATEHLR